ncbi:MAG: hypothetical protein FJ218_10780 [Ignavibacteria bacterium]|nr:hypothetical protein [Ignavibacteria bacterium]
MDEIIRQMQLCLDELKISYVVIGVIAASILGRPRMTMDSDIVLLLEQNQTEQFIACASAKGFSVTQSSKPKIISRLNRGLSVKLRYTKRYSVDVRIASYSIDFQSIKKAKRHMLFDVQLPIVQPEELIVYKLARFDGIDESDIQAVMQRQKKKLNIETIISSTQKLSEETGNEKILENLSTFLKWFKS